LSPSTFLVPVESLRSDLSFPEGSWTNLDGHLIPLLLSVAINTTIKEVRRYINDEVCAADDNQNEVSPLVCNVVVRISATKGVWGRT
jgi:hypothetical protein